MHAFCEMRNAGEVLLACRWHVFPGHNIEERLEGAFDSFHSWCVAQGKKTSLRKFELKTFKMSSCLGLSIMQHMHEGITYHACTTPNKFVYLPYSRVFDCNPRLQSWPGGCGKAHDTTVLAEWLLAVTEGRLRVGHAS